MDYRIRHNREELDSTGYMEIGPGKYTGAHWQDGFAFVGGDAFGVAEGIVAKHFPNYDHLQMNDIPKGIAVKVVSEWRLVADRLPNLDPSEIQRELNLAAPCLADLVAEVESHRLAVANFLRSIADECERFLRQSDWMCILGI